MVEQGYNASMRWVDTNEGLAEAVLELSRHEILGVDTETAFWQMGKEYEKIALLQIACLVDETAKDMPAFLNGFHVRPQILVFLINVYGDNVRLNLRPLREVLESANILKIAHNASFDCRVLDAHLGIKMQPVWCSMRAEKRLQPKKGASLKALAARYFNIDLSKDDQQSRWEHRPLSQQEKLYAAKDAVLCLWLYLLQKEAKLNGRYSHFAEVQQGLPFTEVEDFNDKSDIHKLHTWLKDWIAREGPKEAEKNIWIEARGYPPCGPIDNWEEFAQALEQQIARYEDLQKKAHFLEREEGCGMLLDPGYWAALLRGVHARIMNKEPSASVHRLDAMTARLAKESKETLVRLAEEDAFEREQIGFLIDQADRKANIATVVPLAPVKPDYDKAFELAGQLNRLDLVKRCRKTRWSH